MAGFNRVMLLGNLTRDPEMRYLPSQQAVVNFGMATSRKFKTATGEEREDVVFVDCAAFGRQAEVINQYCQKGKQLFVEGRLKLDTWEDKQGGGKRSKLTVVVENFQLLGGRDGAGGGGGNYQQGGGEESEQRAPQPRTPQRPAPAQQQRPQPEQPFGDEPQFKEDDIPF